MDELAGRDLLGLGGLAQRRLGRRGGPLRQRLEPAARPRAAAPVSGLTCFLRPSGSYSAGSCGVGGERAAHLDRRAHAGAVELDRAQGDGLARERRPRRRAATAASSSSAGILAMYCAFIQSSFSGSKTEGEAPTRSSENSRSISSRVRISRSPPGAQPSSARKLKSASGRMPASRHSSTAAAPWRLESFLRSVPRIMPEVRELRDRARRAPGRARRAWACSRGGRRRGSRA